MTAVLLFDALSRSSGMENDALPASSQGLKRLADDLVATSLADHARNLQYETEFTPRNWNDPEASLAIERSIYSIHQRWAEEATEVLSRVKKAADIGLSVSRADELQRALRRIRAQLTLTPDQVARAMQDIREGRVVPAKELRDELRARLRS